MPGINWGKQVRSNKKLMHPMLVWGQSARYRICGGQTPESFQIQLLTSHKPVPCRLFAAQLWAVYWISLIFGFLEYKMGIITLISLRCYGNQLEYRQHSQGPAHDKLLCRWQLAAWEWGGPHTVRVHVDLWGCNSNPGGKGLYTVGLGRTLAPLVHTTGGSLSTGMPQLTLWSFCLGWFPAPDSVLTAVFFDLWNEFFPIPWPTGLREDILRWCGA